MNKIMLMLVGVVAGLCLRADTLTWKDGLIANFSAQEKPLTLKGLPANAQFIVTDKERTNAKVDRLESLPPLRSETSLL